jgi:hypothetical protein
MTYQTKLRTHEIIPNENICFPIGTILAVKNKYEKLDFSGVFDKYKKKGRDILSCPKLGLHPTRFWINELNGRRTGSRVIT